MWLPLRSDTGAREHWTGQPSEACLFCHVGIEPMHRLDRPTDMFVPRDAAARGLDRQSLTCVDCHGGNGLIPASGNPTKEAAHVAPRHRKNFPSSANPVNSYAALNDESPEFVRFMNPSDFRVADQTCGRCHINILSAMRKSVMSHNAMVHAAVFYNNGGFEWKKAFFGEAFDSEGRAARLVAEAVPRGAKEHGAIDGLVPHPQFPITVIKDPLRVAEVNSPALGVRGPGTDGRIAGVFLNVLKTRLNDPTLWFLGPNKIAGDYRSSGCASCHVIYANDRDPWASAQFAQYGNRGTSFTGDKALEEAKRRSESGHPIRHQFELSVPASQCLVCHYHQGDGAIGTFLGRIWWDRETEAKKVREHRSDPEYGEVDPQSGRYFMERLAEYNSGFNQVQFSDFHAHGWNFVNVYKRGRKGHLLDAAGKAIAEDDTDRWKKAVHLRDIHLEKGMQCIDCHTSQDMHGDGNIYPQMTDYIEIRCTDCHGTVAQRVQLGNLSTSGHPWSTKKEINLRNGKTPFPDPVNPKLRLPQFFERDGKVYQRSKMEPGLEWQVKQVADVVDPNKPEYNPKAAYAKLIRADGSFKFAGFEGNLAHSYNKIECTACHSSWQTTCSGCHLPLDLNVKSRDKHYENQFSRGYAPYYGQLVRTDTFFLGIGTTNHGNKVTPFRPASAVVVSAYDRNRNSVVHQQPLISSPGFANEAMTPHPPHTVRTKETRQCTDCHLSKTGDNNARLAVSLGFGANALTFMGTYVYLAEQGRGITGVRVTDGREPQPVIGSNFHKVLCAERYEKSEAAERRVKAAYGCTESFEKFEAGGRHLRTAYSRHAPRVQSVATRGEYLLAAEGPAGLKLYDIANINNKSVAQRIVQAVNSPLGERTVVPTRNATFVYLPVSLPVHVGGDKPVLDRLASLAGIRRMNNEQPFHDLYRYALLTDSEEGLILVDIDTLSDGDPENNRLSRAVTFNPEGKLAGARMVKTLGNYAYVVSEQTGLSVVDLSVPLAPRLVYQSSPGALNGARAIELQLQYAFVLDRDGIKVLEVSDREKPRPLPEATVRLADARGITLSRSYAYIAAGKDGLVIVDIEHPEQPAVLQYNKADVPLDDSYDVAVAATNVSFFAYVADGRNGLRVVRLVEPPDTPGHLGFAPTPTPRLIATYPTSGVAVAVSRGQIRDRFVDESGNQIAVTNRLGSRPLNLNEIRRFLFYSDGEPLQVNDEVPEDLQHKNVTPETKLSRPGGKSNASAASALQK